MATIKTATRNSFIDKNSAKYVSCLEAMFALKTVSIICGLVCSKYTAKHEAPHQLTSLLEKCILLKHNSRLSVLTITRGLVYASTLSILKTWQVMTIKSSAAMAKVDNRQIAR